MPFFVAIVTATVMAITSIIGSLGPETYIAQPNDISLLSPSPIKEIHTESEPIKVKPIEYQKVSTTTPLQGKISWYDYGFDDDPLYSENNATCASRDYPRGALLQVTTKDGSSVICRTNDYVENPNVILDLSSYAFKKLASLSLGLLDATVENIACSCIKTARYFGISIPHNTDAEDLKPNSMPQEGSLALFKFDNGQRHVAVVEKIKADMFLVKQGNKKKCEITEEWISWDDPTLLGFAKMPINQGIFSLLDP